MSQTEDYNPGDSLPDHSEKLLQRLMVFSSFTYCQNKTLNKSGICFFKFSKQMDRHAYMMLWQYGLATWEGSICDGVPALASQEGRQHMLYFWSMCPCIIKVDVQCVFDTPQTSYFSSVQLLSRVRLFANPCAAGQTSLSITNSRSLFKLMSIESVMPSNHIILCRPLLLPPSIFPSIRVFSNESVLRNR